MKRSIAIIFLISFGLDAHVSVALAQQTNEPSQSAVLEEIVVTARFRDESVQDIGASIAAYGGDQIDALGIESVSDLAALTPSLNLSDRGPNRNEISIRGIGRSLFQQDVSLSPANIGLYFDDVPVNMPTGAQLDIRSFDLARVEVLRGPQGTLFGEGAQGGAIRYVSADPDLTEFGGAVEVYASTITDGDTGFGGGLMLNMPLSEDKVGLRLSAYRTDQGGFIDNVADGTEDTNGFDANTIRAVLLAKPNDRFRARLMATYEEFSQGAFPRVDSNTDDLVFGLSTAGNFTDDEYSIFSANLSYNFGPLELISISSIHDRKRSREQIEMVNSLISTIFNGFASFVPSNQIDTQDWQQVSQEFRLVSDLDGPFNFVAGAFYKDFELEIVADARSSIYAPFWGATFGTPVNVPSGLASEVAAALGLDAIFGTPIQELLTNDGDQFSLFAEGTFELNDAWKVIAGVRYHKEDITAATTAGLTGLISVGAPTPAFSADTDIEIFLPKFSVEYQPNDSVLAYVTYSEGVRNGNLNSPGSLGIIAGDPALGGLPAALAVAAYDEELVKAVELGLKTSFRDDTLRLNGSIYQNKIEDLQGFVIFGALGGIVANVGDGQSQGIEAELVWRANDFLNIFAGANFTEAELEEPRIFSAPAVATFSNDQKIPFIPETTYSLGAQVTVPSSSSDLIWDGSIVYTYSDEYTTFFQGDEGTIANPYIGDHSILNLSVGVSGERWKASLRVDNVLDEREIIGSGPFDVLFGGPPPGAAGLTYDDRIVTRPRMATLTLQWNF